MARPGAAGNVFDRPRLVAVWRRVLGLSWPVMVQHVVGTLMRTTDMLVAGLFSPAAVAAIGLADLYTRFTLWLGLGIGTGAISLSSQETGRGATAGRDGAITQAILLSLLAGVPFVLVGHLFGEPLIALLGAAPAVVRAGAAYLAVVLLASPLRIAAITATRALQGTGNTRTPMYVNVAGNGLNIVGSVVLGLGLLGAPRLGVVGVGVATAGAHAFMALALFAALASPWTAAGFAWPRDPTLTRQLVVVSAPPLAEGVSSSLVKFPFNAILLGFGTEVNAAYHIARRLFQQLSAPVSRGLRTGASITVGQAVGAGEAERAGFDGRAVTLLATVVVGVIGAGLVALAPPLVRLFTADPTTVAYGVAFTRTFGVAGPLLAVFAVVSGALAGAGHTRPGFYARLSAGVVFMIGLTYALGVGLGWGPTGAYVGIVTAYAWMGLVVAVVFLRGGWADHAAALIAERAEVPDGP